MHKNIYILILNVVWTHNNSTCHSISQLIFVSCYCPVKARKTTYLQITGYFLIAILSNLIIFPGDPNKDLL